MIERDNSTVNYHLSNSHSINYEIHLKSPSPESFPEIMNNGVLVDYTLMNFDTKIVEDRSKEKIATKISSDASLT